MPEPTTRTTSSRSLRWDRIDCSTGVVDVCTAGRPQVNTVTWEQGNKTHRRRRIVADPQTLALLQSAARTAASLGIELPEDGFVFSGSPDHGT